MQLIPEDTYEGEVILRLLEILLEEGKINKPTMDKIKRKYYKEGERNGKQ